MPDGKLDSKHILRTHYDHFQGTLEVEFASGVAYRYFGVDASTYHDLLYATSAGKYHREHIKDVYPFERVEKKDAGAEDEALRLGSPEAEAQRDGLPWGDRPNGGRAQEPGE